MTTGKEESASQGRPMPRWIIPGLAVLGLAMIFGFGAYVVGLLSSINDQHGRMQSLQAELEKNSDLLTVIGSEDLAYVVLSPITAPDSCHARLFWDQKGKIVLLQVFRLPAPASGLLYQLWAVEGNRQVSAGIFAPTSRGVEYFRFDSLAVVSPGDVTAFVVTREKKGGAASPAGPIVLAGSTQQ